MSYNNKTLVGYHQNCHDGIAAAWVVFRDNPSRYEFYPADYALPPPDVSGRDVILVDFSYPPEVLLEMGQKAKSVVVIDHHDSFKKRLETYLGQSIQETTGLPLQLAENIKIVFDGRHSGAVLTWKYFNPNQRVPEFLSYVNAYDLGKFTVPGAMEFNLGFKSLGIFSMDIHEAFMEITNLSLEEEDPRSTLKELMAAGAGILKFQKATIRDLIAMNKIDGKIRRLNMAGHFVPFVNVPRFLGSDLLNQLAEHEPFAVGYSDYAGFRRFELRSHFAKEGQSQALNVAMIAEKFKGGGHPRASGFVLPLSDDMSFYKLSGNG